ncbi:anti-sigma-K factor rskA [Gillisia sp. Hel_I_86]|uniref:anti-sigma factor n=1 Tax=Gillisia sp. Hel_I_86 TaxID=1249981 RepID=UPI00119A021D|nr:anti-sigma factor [Gillisia sp. Hel_I_86]TVZ27614.1 anti-sigma-K factor rskA [Gillisia sp. Hel_I_86]
MDINNYISSGILELYVYGALSEPESREVTRILKQFPEVESEVEEIEEALIQLSAAVAPADADKLIQRIKQKLSHNPKVVTMKSGRSNIPMYIGWAASLIFLIGLFLMFNKNQKLRQDLQALQGEKAQMETQIAEARLDAEKTKELLSIIRDKDIIKVPLAGQAVAPDAYAAAYWDKTTNTTYIDVKDLPEPPRGMVYQVWSLQLEPLTPTSIGILDTYEEDENKIFPLENTNPSEAFGITLEPARGSKTPTMEQLYALGVVSS